MLELTNLLFFVGKCGQGSKIKSSTLFHMKLAGLGSIML